MSRSIPESAINEYFVECQEIINRVTKNLTLLEKHDFNQELIDELYRDFHTLKGSSQLFGFQTVGLLAHSIEASLEPFRKHKLKLEKIFIDHIFKFFDLLEKIIANPNLETTHKDELKSEVNLYVSKLVEMSLLKFKGDYYLAKESISSQNDFNIEKPNITKVEGFNKIESVLSKPVETPVKTENIQPIIKQKTEKVMSTNQTIQNVSEEQNLEASTIRVQVGLLDKLMNLAGEMVLTRNQVLQYAKSSDDNELISMTQKLDLVTTELQDNIMKTRMQPIGSIFNKFQRVVRDLSRDLNKKIDLVIQGAETEVDKSLIEAIKDPLTHIIRNSCDHGLETPEARKSRGKKDTGSLFLNAYHEGGQVVIEIKDDGKGIDPDIILAKAIDKRIINKDEASLLSRKEIQELIFAPGFSTAEQVSSVSGRGVGMDVVKTNVERVGGLVELESIPNQGTTIKLRIPLTLAIVPAMIISSGADKFAIPQVKLQELIRIDTEEDGTKIEILQDQMIYRLRGELLPLVDLENILANKKDLNKKTIYNIVVLKTETSNYGLIVDQILDTADIVVKPLSNFFKSIKAFSGATIMGDGSVALILDIQGIAESSKIQNKSLDRKKNVHQLVKEKSLFREETEYLFFHLNNNALFSIPLILVQRLEEFPASKVEYSGTERVVQYRNSLLPLIFLNEVLDIKGSIDKQDKYSIIVVSKRNRLFGLVVNEIVDILTTSNEIIPLAKERKDILGTLVATEDKIVTVINSMAIIDEIMGYKHDDNLDIKKKKLTGKILFAEDTIFFVKQVTKILSANGLEVVHAPDGEKALELLKSSKPGEFQVVLSDIEMPIMNGFDLAKSIRKESQFASIPLVALTTRIKESDQKLGIESGFNYYLEKLKSDELIDVLSKIIGGKS